MRSVQGKRGQVKDGDILLEGVPRDKVLEWLGADAEYQAALCVEAVAWLLRGGWSMPELQGLVGLLHAQGFIQSVVERVYERSPERSYGRARVGAYRDDGEVHAELPRARVGRFTMEDD